MTWVKGIVGVVCVLIGLAWIGQGIGLLPGSVMSGQLMWAVIGAVVLVIGAYLLWSLFARAARSARASP